MKKKVWPDHGQGITNWYNHAGVLFLVRRGEGQRQAKEDIVTTTYRFSIFIAEFSFNNFREIFCSEITLLKRINHMVVIKKTE